MTPGCLMAVTTSLRLNSLVFLSISPLKSGMKMKDSTPSTAMTTPRKTSRIWMPWEASAMAEMMAVLIKPTIRPAAP